MTAVPDVALVAGATAGLDREGAAVIADILSTAGRRVSSADPPSPPGSPHLAREAGEVNVLVNNAGYSLWSPMEDMSADVNGLFAVNVHAPLLLIAAFTPGMLHEVAARSSTSPAWLKKLSQIPPP